MYYNYNSLLFFLPSHSCQPFWSFQFDPLLWSVHDWNIHATSRAFKMCLGQRLKPLRLLWVMCSSTAYLVFLCVNFSYCRNRTRKCLPKQVMEEIKLMHVRHIQGLEYRCDCKYPVNAKSRGKKISGSGNICRVTILFLLDMLCSSSSMLFMR